MMLVQSLPFFFLNFFYIYIFIMCYFNLLLFFSFAMLKRYFPHWNGFFSFFLSSWLSFRMKVRKVHTHTRENFLSTQVMFTICNVQLYIGFSVFGYADSYTIIYIVNTFQINSKWANFNLTRTCLQTGCPSTEWYILI